MKTKIPHVQKTILITGASTGIGEAVTKQLVNEGHKVIGIARNEKQLKKLEKSSDCHSGSFEYIKFDLCELDNFDKLVSEIKSFYPKIDHLLNNAGYLINSKFENVSLKELQTSININLSAPFLLIQKLLPLFNDNSHIVNISSMGGVQGSAKFPGLSIYSATKGGLSILTEALAEELKPRGISVNALAPGAVQTDMLRQVFPEYTAPICPEKMSEWVCWFLLNGHNFFNGKVLPVSTSTP